MSPTSSPRSSGAGRACWRRVTPLQDQGMRRFAALIRLSEAEWNALPGRRRRGIGARPSQKRKTGMRQQGRILGIGGIFFKSAQQQPMREWYAQHLGLADSGHGVMLPWREHDHPDHEQMTVWSIF